MEKGKLPLLLLPPFVAFLFQSFPPGLKNSFFLLVGVCIYGQPETVVLMEIIVIMMDMQILVIHQQLDLFHIEGQKLLIVNLVVHKLVFYLLDLESMYSNLFSFQAEMSFFPLTDRKDYNFRLENLSSFHIRDFLPSS
jgi:hypothetical protein